MVQTLNQGLKRKAKQAWWRIFIYPRDTIRALLDLRREGGWLAIGALMGMAQVANTPLLYPGDASGAGAVFSWILLLGPLAGWALLLVGGVVAWKLGQILFRGEGAVRDIRVALGWGSMPLILSLLLWFPLIALTWGEGFLEGLRPFLPVFGICWIWTAYCTSQGLAEAHRLRFSQGLILLILTVSLLSLPLGMLVGPGGG